MDSQTLIARTPKGTVLSKLNNGGYQVCDSEQHCHFCGDLYRAEEVVREIESGYGYPYATSFHRTTP
jgi:hypothetical protein|tara:strand:- start:4036 stop:4236 length:201 start_codon:yes stop_codon:yes gene_type:complete